MKPADRVIFNTGILYSQQIIGMIIGLYTTRLILDALGETDYGVYVLVGGIVGMLGILNASMSQATMRFMSHSLGTGDKNIVLRTFNTSVFIHVIIGFFVILIMELGGWVLFEFVLNIPKEKLFDAKVVFQFMVITTFITIISTPYDAVMYSHENIFVSSIISMLGIVFGLGIALYLTFSSKYLLITYGLLVLINQVLLRIIKQWYSRVKYEECKINLRIYVDRKLARGILSFSGWEVFGNISAMSVTSLRGVLLNIFYGVNINAAEGISRNVSSYVNMISVHMVGAIKPQLLKSEGGGDRQRMLRITEISTKYSTFLFALLAIPMVLEASFVLNLWLKKVPEHTVIFCQLILITLMIEKLSFQVNIAVKAVGDIRGISISELLLIVCNIPLSYFVLKSGAPPYIVYLIGVVICFPVFINRLYWGRRIAELNISAYLKNSVLPILVPIIVASILAYLSRLYLDESITRLFITTFISITVLTTLFFIWGIEKTEAEILKQSLKSISQEFKFRYLNNH